MKFLISLLCVFSLFGCDKTVELPSEGHKAFEVPASLLISKLNDQQFTIIHPIAFDTSFTKGVRLGKGNILGRDVQLGRKTVSELYQMSFTLTNSNGLYVITDGR